MKFKNPLSKKKSDGDAQPPSNPYASPPSGGDPYMNGNSFSNSNANSNPPPYQSVAQDQYRREKSPAVTGPGGGYGSGYGGSSGGYGRNQPYGAPQSHNAADGARRPGGYGGFGSDDQDADVGRSSLFGNAPQRHGPTPQNSASAPNNSYDNRTTSQQYQQTPKMGGSVAVASYNQSNVDPGRDALFGNAAQKFQQKQQSTARGHADPGISGNFRGSGDDGYDGYGSSNVTAEEEEEIDIDCKKQEMKNIKRAGLQSLQNTRQLLDQSMQSASTTLGNLVAQNERLANTERVMDASSAQNKIAAQNASTLRKTNASMFYRGSAKKQDVRDNQNLRDHQEDRAEKERLLMEVHVSKTKAQAAQQELERKANGTGWQKPSLNERAKYQFENDSEDDAMEDEMENQFAYIHNGASGLKVMATAIGDQINGSNQQLDRLNRKTDKVDDQITANRARLDRIR